MTETEKQSCATCKYWNSTGGGGGFCEHPKVYPPYFMVSIEGNNCAGYKHQKVKRLVLKGRQND